MSSADDQPPAEPWSPYPVQDWSRLPEDLLARPAVHPSWPPPPPARRPRTQTWWPVAVLLVIGLLLAGTSYAGVRAVDPASEHRALRFLPADGSVSYDRVETTRELETTTTTEVSESALLTGVTALLSTDSVFGTRAMSQLFGAAKTLRVWRTTSTLLADQVATPQTTRLYRVDAAVELLGESTPTEGYTYTPALVELPAEVAPGQSWSSSGSAGDSLDYRTDFRAAAGEQGCLEVTGEIGYAARNRGVSRVVEVARTWCPGQGLVASSQSLAPVRTLSRRIPPPPPQPSVTVDEPIRWRDPAAWTAKTLDTVSINPVYGQGPMNGAVATDITPVRTGSGLVVRAMAAPRDLVATTPKTLQAWTSVWRAHPGGNILTLTAFGNVVVVTTSERQVVGYSDTGVRLWQIALDELAPTPPVRVSDDQAVLADLSGEVRRFDLATGAPSWRHDIGSDVRVAPAAGSGLVVVADRSDTVTALDAATGAERWTQSLDVTAVTVAGDLVVAVQDQTAHALAIDTGRHRWLRHFDGTFARLLPVGDSVLLAATSSSVLIDHQGAVRAELPGYLNLTPTEGVVVGWGTQRAEVFDAAGRVILDFDTPDVSVVSAARPGLAVPEGVLLFGLDWTFAAWTDA